MTDRYQIFKIINKNATRMRFSTQLALSDRGIWPRLKVLLRLLDDIVYARALYSTIDAHRRAGGRKLHFQLDLEHINAESQRVHQ